MHTVERRVYDTDSEGRRFLLHRPGDVITPKEAKRVASLVEPDLEKPGWMLFMERRKAPADETPTKPLGGMTVKELRAVCEDEEINPKGANMRADYIKVICATRGQRQAKSTNER
jgi:hypothetical protein